PADVAAGGKGATCTGQYDHIGTGIIGRVVEDRGKFAMHRLVDGVQLGGTVEDERQDASAPFGTDGTVAGKVRHRACSWTWMLRKPSAISAPISASASAATSATGASDRKP